MLRDWPGNTLALLGAALPGIFWHFFTAQTDSLLITGVLIAFVGFIKVRLGLLAGRFPWELWAGVALATAAKGPVGIACTLPVMALEVGISVLVDPKVGRSLKQRVLSLVRGLLPLAWARGLSFLALAILPWYAVTGIVHGADFVRAVVVYQNFDRFVTGFDHLQPWWYHFGSVLAGLFPVSLLLPVGLYAGIRGLSRFPQRLAFTWVVFTFLFFSISASKQGKYILPAAPAFLLLGMFGLETQFKDRTKSILGWLKAWSVFVIATWGALVIFYLPIYSPRIANVSDYAIVREVVSARPGQMISYQWPRSLMLYELGHPMDFVRSSRELYEKIRSGVIESGDYLLVSERYLAESESDDKSVQLIPRPGKPWFEHVLDLETEKKLQVYRVLPGADELVPPATPEPPKIGWRDARFDTD